MFLLPVLISSLLFLGGCGNARSPRPNIVLIVVDTLRPDRLPFYGHKGNTAPFLSTLAARGAVFRRVHSTSSWTAPATASIHTSLYPVQHSVLTGFRAARVRQQGELRIRLNAIPDEVETLAETLREAGYNTCAVTDNINISRDEGFDQGFDRFWNFNYQGAEAIGTTLKEWKGEIRGRRPYFLYLHYMDPHRPYHKRTPWYSPQPDSVRDDLAAYDSEIRYVDQHIEEAFQLFGWDRNTLFILTSDHGEEFQDHGGWDHGRTLYGEVMDVPLLVYSSGDSLVRKVFEQPVSVLDILPTLREEAGLPVDPAEQGVSLLPALRGQAPPPTGRAFYAHLHSAPWFGDEVLKAVIEDGSKCIYSSEGDVELYDLRADPQERQNLAGKEAAVADRWVDQAERVRSSWPRHEPHWNRVGLSVEQVQKLRSFGYIN